jgi:aminoglycoside/choline kinase family phosphotransferase
MTRRDALAARFLARTDWADASRRPLAGDASNRRYDRLTDPTTGRTAVLMDAPPDKGEDVRPFVSIARHLSSVGLSAPLVLAEDAALGFLVLEDLGDDLFARVIPRQPDLEAEMYRTATDVLVALHRAPLPDVAPYAPHLMADLSTLAFTRYQAALDGATDAERDDRFRQAFARVLEDTTGGPQVLIQRDYHAENLLWLPERKGIARVGLLDFQDAMAGHPAYDLVSLLQDARRDVPARVETAMIAHFLGATGHDPAAFRAAYAALSVQRNLRIIGVFARLCIDRGRTHYVDLIPRVWAYMQPALDHPALTPVRKLVRDGLTPPGPAQLARLKSLCPTR